MRSIGVFFGVLGLAFAWWIGTRLSADAIGVIVGVTVGVMASIPAALLVLYAGRRNDGPADDRQCSQLQLRDSPYAPPVIIFHSAPAQLPAPQQQQWQQPAQRQATPMPASRAFRVVGENEECMFEDWVAPTTEAKWQR